MSDDDAGLPDDRFTFVVGKGGVGKTTIAAALALARADCGRATRLLSTDPAHSLADVFDEPVQPDIPARSRCAEPLILEAFDADAYARRWMNGARASIAELVEKGTYLDKPEIERMLELSPAIHEVAAGWRLADLALGNDHAADRVVVDTAPTGHLPRLLDAGATARSWADALEAMAEKAGVVASSFAGREVRFEAEHVIHEIRSRADAFERAVLADAAFVIVTRPESVTLAETARLAREIQRRGLRLGRRITIGGMENVPEFDGVRIPLAPALGPRGCEGLRWVARQLTRGSGPSLSRAREGSAEPGESEPPARFTGPGGSDLTAEAADPGIAVTLRSWPPILLFAGKGGVGKSTCAAACALTLAGRRTVDLFDADPAGSASDVLGMPVPEDGLRVTERLRVRRLDAAEAFSRFRDQHRADVERFFEGMGLERGATLDRRVVESLIQLAPPGMDEIAGLARILELADAEESEALVIDAAPTGHLLRLIRMPELALDWVHALMRVLLAHRAGGGLDDVAERMLGLARRIRSLSARLTDGERAAVIIVTMDEPLIEAETRRLADALARADMAVGAVIRNRTPAGARNRDPAGATNPEFARIDPAASATASIDDSGPPIIDAPFVDGGIEGVDALRSFAMNWERAA